MIVGLVIAGGGAALMRNAQTSRVEHRTALFTWRFETLEDHPYGVVVDNGKLYRFRESTALRYGDPIDVRFDGLGRVLGTTRQGIYHPKFDAPGEIVPTVVGLVLVAVGAFLAWRNLQIARGRRARARKRVRRLAYALLGITAIGLAVRAAVGSITEHVTAFTVEAPTPGLPITDGYGWDVLVKEGQSFRYNFPTGLAPGEVLLSRTDGLGHRLSSSFHGRVVPVRPQPRSLVPQALIIGALGVGWLVYAIRVRDPVALPPPPEATDMPSSAG
jgi:hypothetical protein